MAAHRFSQVSAWCVEQSAVRLRNQAMNGKTGLGESHLPAIDVQFNRSVQIILVIKPYYRVCQKGIGRDPLIVSMFLKNKIRLTDFIMSWQDHVARITLDYPGVIKAGNSHPCLLACLHSSLLYP
jgi:hypothetical protein